MKPEDVSSREDLVAFLRECSREKFSVDQERPVTAEELLEAMAAWLEGAPSAPFLKDFVSSELGESPTWKGLAVLIHVGRIYE
jgi:hypothetical protein